MDVDSIEENRHNGGTPENNLNASVLHWKPSVAWLKLFLLPSLLTLAVSYFLFPAVVRWPIRRSTTALFALRPEIELCPQTTSLKPHTHHDVWKSLSEYYSSGDFVGRAVDLLGGAVKISTESHDDTDGIGKEEHLREFFKLHSYLRKAFPLTHSKLKLTKINKYGLLYHWKGTEPAKDVKPLLLLAHQDVVPVDNTTINEWKHPPYSGVFDGETLWGRGSIDDKSALIGILISVENLISKGFSPRRSVFLSFGFDEEVSGKQGARKLAKYLLKQYGENSFAMLVDEGCGIIEAFGAPFAVPGVGEKGYMNVRMNVSSPGGHSSIPPPHTSIGILAALLAKYEDNPFPVEISRQSPVYDMLLCVAAHAPNLDKSVRKIIEDSVSSDDSLQKLEQFVSSDRQLRSLAGTTQAIDVIRGGVKANALPENAWAIINHRIATQSSVEKVQARDASIIEELVEKFNLSYKAFGKDIRSSGGLTSGSVEVSDAFGTALKPAQITPTGKDAVAFQVLSGTIIATYDEIRRNETFVKNVVVAPGIMTGNTDSRHYWDLTENIFRYNQIYVGDPAKPPGVHTVNEGISMKSFSEIVLFFTTLILNVDESRGL